MMPEVSSPESTAGADPPTRRIALMARMCGGVRLRPGIPVFR